MCNVADLFDVGASNFYPINTLHIPLQNPILDHVTPDGCGVIVVLGDDRIEFLLGILGGGG